MKIPRSKAIVLAIGIAAAVALGLVACGYDWSVGPAAQPTEAGAPDAATDAPVADASRPYDADAGYASQDAAADAPAEAAATLSCAELALNLNSARTAAQTCAGISSGECTKWVADECNCESYVAILDAGKTTAYVAAIGAFLDAGCSSPSCDGGCTLFAGACISNPNLSGTFICD